MLQCKYIFKGVVLLAICFAVYAIVIRPGRFSLSELIASVSEPEEFGCGVVDMYPPVKLSEAASAGKAPFQIWCQSCHSIFKDLSGPALGTALENPFWSDPLKVVRYIQNPETLSKEKYISELRSKFGLKQHPFPDLTDEQLMSIQKYITEEKQARDAMQ